MKNRLFNLSRTTIIQETIDGYESTFCLKITILDDLIENEDRIAIEQRLNSLLDILYLNKYTYIGKGRDNGEEAGEHCAIFYKKDRFDVLDQGDFWYSETPETPSKG